VSLRKKFLIYSSILIFASCCVAFYTIQAGSTTVIAGDVFDAANGMPVFDATISVGNRTTKTFLLKKFRLTSIPAGKVQLTVSAPMYETARIELDISKKNISLDIPLRGEKIEGLTGVLVWAVILEEGLYLDIRLTNENGETMIHFPSMPLKADVRIYENIGTQESPKRGKTLYEGQPAILDEPSKGLKRLKCIIPLNEIAKSRLKEMSAILDFTVLVQNDTLKFSRYDLNIRN